MSNEARYPHETHPGQEADPYYSDCYAKYDCEMRPFPSGRVKTLFQKVLRSHGMKTVELINLFCLERLSLKDFDLAIKQSDHCIMFNVDLLRSSKSQPWQFVNQYPRLFPAFL